MNEVRAWPTRNAQRGWSLPITWILLFIIGGLVWYYGWTVLIWVLGMAAFATAGTWIYDRVTHDRNCRYCNVIKDKLLGEHGIDPTRVTTEHVEELGDHMLVQVRVDGEDYSLVDIDYNGTVLGMS